jgi:hypothetical protein
MNDEVRCTRLYKYVTFLVHESSSNQIAYIFSVLTPTKV